MTAGPNRFSPRISQHIQFSGTLEGTTSVEVVVTGSPAPTRRNAIAAEIQASVEGYAIRWDKERTQGRRTGTAPGEDAIAQPALLSPQ